MKNYRILLVNLNTYDQPYPVYPLGLAYLMGALDDAGYGVKIWDARMAENSLEACVADYMPDMVGLSIRNVDNVQFHNPKSFVHEVLDTCQRIRKVSHAKLLIGGSGFSVFPRELFALSAADFGIQGEGERSFVLLIEALEKGLPMDTIPGLHYRNHLGEPKVNLRNPNDVVFTSEPLHDAELLTRYHRSGSLPGLQTQRGCPLKCCYCTYPAIEGKSSRLRSGADVVAEMRRLKELGIRHVFIVDSVFNTNPNHVKSICTALAKAKLGMNWECFLRPRGVDEELLKLMQEAGLSHVEFGSDSFSNTVLKSYGKSFTFKDIYNASTAAHALGIRYSHFAILGGPGETEATLEESLRNAESLPSAYFFATLGMRIYPETPLWHQLAPEKNGESAIDYLAVPRFYLAPEFELSSLFAQMQAHQKKHPNWMIGDPPPEFIDTMQKLRARGVVGSLWEYAELLQRFRQQSANDF